MRALWTIAGVLSLLVACGGGVGTGGTGAFASGPISGFGSIIVDGVRFDETGALIEDDADQLRDRDALRLGTVVEVDSGVVRDGEAGASRVRIVSALIGRVEAIDAGALTVNGLAVRLNANTAIDDRFVGGVAGITVGRVVEVHGFAMGGAAGEVLATRVESADAAPAFKFRGVAWALDQAARTFRIGTQQFAYAAQVSGRNELREGAFVRVRTTTARDAQGRWPVTLIAGVTPPADRAEAHAEGVINAYTSAVQFEVGGLAVDASAASIQGGRWRRAAGGGGRQAAGRRAGGAQGGGEGRGRRRRDPDARRHRHGGCGGAHLRLQRPARAGELRGARHRVRERRRDRSRAGPARAGGGRLVGRRHAARRAAYPLRELNDDPCRAMSRRPLLMLAAAGALAGCMTAPPAAPPDLDALQREVRATEIAFARTMAERDFAAFARHLSPHAVFWSGQKVLRGKAAVLAEWQRFYAAPQAPFSWEPDAVVVLGDGTLAQSSGPVRDAAGKTIARFRSVWRREADGRWLIVLDRGEPADARP